MRKTAEHSGDLLLRLSRTRTRLSSHSAKEFSAVRQYTISSTLLRVNLSSRPEKKSARLLQTSLTLSLSSRWKSVQCSLASPVRVSARSATDVTSLQAGWLKRERLSVSLRHSQSVSLVHSLHFVHSTSEVRLQVLRQTAQSLPSTTENSSSRSSGQSRGFSMTAQNSLLLSAAPQSSASSTRTPVSPSLSTTCLMAQSFTRRMAKLSRRETSSANGTPTTQSPSSRPTVSHALTVWLKARTSARRLPTSTHSTVTKSSLRVVTRPRTRAFSSLTKTTKSRSSTTSL